MRKFYPLVLLALLLALPYRSFAQKDTTTTNKDSIAAATLVQYNNSLAQIEQQRIQDSVKRTQLEAQLQSLKTTDNLKKEELQKQLEELNNREDKRLTAKKEQIDQLRSKIKGSAVRGFFNDTLFIYTAGRAAFHQTKEPMQSHSV